MTVVALSPMPWHLKKLLSLKADNWETALARLPLAMVVYQIHRKPAFLPHLDRTTAENDS